MKFGFCYNPNSMRFERESVTGKTIGILALACALILGASAEQRAQKKDETQTLQPVRDLPLVVEGDPRHFAFFVTPLSSKGLLSKQVHDALSALSHDAKNDPVLKIRAFVAGSGD